MSDEKKIVAGDVVTLVADQGSPIRVMTAGKIYKMGGSDADYCDCFWFSKDGLQEKSIPVAALRVVNT